MTEAVADSGLSEKYLIWVVPMDSPHVKDVRTYTTELPDTEYETVMDYLDSIGESVGEEEYVQLWNSKGQLPNWMCGFGSPSEWLYDPWEEGEDG